MEHITHEVKCIVEDIRSIIDEIGEPKGEQAFCYWICANNLLNILLVCDTMDHKSVNAVLSRAARVRQGAMSSYTTEYWFHVVISTYWDRKY